MKRTILYITDTAAIVGGGEVSLLNLLQNIDRTVFEVMALVPGTHQLYERIQNMGIAVSVFEYRKAGHPGNIAHTLQTIRRIADIIRASHVELVHTNSTGGVMFVAAIAARLTRVKLVSHVRIFDSGLISDIVQGLFSDRLIMISHCLRRKPSFLASGAKSRVIHNGVDLAAFRPMATAGDFRKAIGCPAEALLVGLVGTYQPGKGFEYALEAFARISPQIKDMRLALVSMLSDADYAGFIARRVQELGISDRVILVGRQEDMPAVLNGMDIFVFPSLIDAFGRVLIEAMACARPVIAFDRAVNREIVRDNINGFLVEPRNVAALAERIRLLAQDPLLRQRLGLAARANCEQRFDIVKLTRSIEQLYLELLGDPQAGYVSCAACGAAATRPFCTCRIAEADALIPEQAIALCRCARCGLVFINPRPASISAENSRLYTKAYFESGYMRFYADKAGAAQQANEPFDLRMRLIRAYKESGTLLDIGCAGGAFLAFARAQGWQVYGADISDFAVEAARRDFGITVEHCRFEDGVFQERFFDVASAGDVLEHASDPGLFLRAVRRILKDDGILYLAVPDFDGLQYRLKSLVARFNHRNYFVLPHHLYHFNRRTLEALLVNEGFEVLSRRRTESRIQEKNPLKRFCMRAVFLFARIARMQDRLVVIAQKRQGAR